MVTLMIPIKPYDVTDNANGESSTVVWIENRVALKRLIEFPSHHVASGKPPPCLPRNKKESLQASPLANNKSGVWNMPYSKGLIGEYLKSRL